MQRLLSRPRCRWAARAPVVGCQLGAGVRRKANSRRCSSQARGNASEERGQLEPLELPAFGDHLRDVRREQGQGEHLRNLASGNLLVGGQFRGRPKLPLSIWRRRPWARTSALITTSSKAGLSSSPTRPTGTMTSLRSPRYRSFIGIRIVTPLTSISGLVLMPPPRVRAALPPAVRRRGCGALRPGAGGRCPRCRRRAARPAAQRAAPAWQRRARAGRSSAPRSAAFSIVGAGKPPSPGAAARCP